MGERERESSYYWRRCGPELIDNGAQCAVTNDLGLVLQLRVH